MSQELIRLVEARGKKETPPEFRIGDTVNVHCKIFEGSKERVQIFSGVVIARSGGGSRETFTVRHIVAGEGVERKFPLHSPRIATVEVIRSAYVNRCKLYFLRDRVGKAVRLRERRIEKKIIEGAKPVKARRGKKAKAAKLEAKKQKAES